MRAWQELERLATMASVLQARLSRAAEYGDNAEIYRIRIELMKIAEERKSVVASLGAEIDTVDPSRAAMQQGTDTALVLA